jgi:putative ubiquitin-RnfH superfamily antitoxin RatB of RatAB toxin-antitoxin module
MIVEVAYALPDKQSLISLEVEEGTTIKEAIEASGVLDTYDQIDLTRDKVGIFSKFATLDTVLREKDRVEIYRPLIADPKKVRKERAAKGKQCVVSKKPNPR